VVTPPGLGAVSVTVTQDSCPAAPQPPAQYTYKPTPVVTSISPKHGSQRGGTPVTIRGRNFDTVPGATSFKFGLSDANNVHCESSTKCAVTSPAYSVFDQNGVNPVDIVAWVDVVMNTDLTAADQFTYDGKIRPPTCTGTSCQ
jgi:hypothetical protein